MKITLGRMLDDYLDPDRHLWQEEPPDSYQVVLDFFSVENEAECKRSIYKNTDCGAWIEFTKTGIVIGSIVEGCNWGTTTYLLYYADEFTSKDIQDRIDAVEAEASAIWDWANKRCDKNGKWRRNGSYTLAELGIDAPDIDYDYRHFKQGERSS